MAKEIVTPEHDKYSYFYKVWNSIPTKSMFFSIIPPPLATTSEMKNMEALLAHKEPDMPSERQKNVWFNFTKSFISMIWFGLVYVA